MASDDPLVIGVGMITAVGLTARETATSVRAGTMRFAEAPFQDHARAPFTLASVPDEALAPSVDGAAPHTSTARETRLLRLAAAALAECLTSLPADARIPPVALALPEHQPSKRIDGGRFVDLLSRQVGNRIAADRSTGIDTGRAGGLAAIARAGDMVRSGESPFAIAGGVDTYRDLYVLGTLDMEKRVKSAVHLDGFVPGEAAAFVLLATSKWAGLAGSRRYVSVSRTALGMEPGHLYSEVPYLGEGLASTITSLVQAHPPGTPFAEVWSSMNGESHWGKEWGVSLLRNRAAFTDDHAFQHPADCVGDVGAAVGPLLVGLAALGVQGGYRRSPALVYCSSDHGGRAALAISQA